MRPQNCRSYEKAGWLCALLLFSAGVAFGRGQYFEVAYPPSTQSGELQLGVTYTLWVPENTAKLRGIIVHQHGCGAPACQGGATAAYDLHWQALARKWDCALLGPSYQQADNQDCGLWCDPRKGSGQAFLKALTDLAAQSHHPELAQVPWCLWGHSGGGYWVGVMQILHPERIVGIWFRSGTAGLRGLSRDGANLEMSQVGYGIPAICNPGVKEKGDQRFSRIWTSAMSTFQSYRAQGAPIAFAPDPRTSHECGDSRYLAIPFFDACLGMRLPDKNSKDSKLKPVNAGEGWLAAPLSAEAVPGASWKSNALEAVWLPNEKVAKAWMEYVKTGAVSDTTPPPAPFNVKISRQAATEVELTWDAEADLESGIQAFIIERDGKEIGRVPEKPVGKFGRPLFQTMSYHDTPEKPLPEMRYVDARPEPGAKHQYRVITVNSVGLRSAPSAAFGGRR